MYKFGLVMNCMQSPFIPISIEDPTGFCAGFINFLHAVHAIHFAVHVSLIAVFASV